MNTTVTVFLTDFAWSSVTQLCSTSNAPSSSRSRGVISEHFSLADLEL